MMFENNSIRNGLLALLQGSEPKYNLFGWIGWVLLILLVVDMLNHYRLFAALNKWAEKERIQKSFWVIFKVISGMFFALFIIIGIPLLVSAIKGGVPNWTEPYKYAPDLILWLLVGMGLNLIRNFIQLTILLRRSQAVNSN